MCFWPGAVSGINLTHTRSQAAGMSEPEGTWGIPKCDSCKMWRGFLKPGKETSPAGWWQN